jgi:DNA polymerase III subunit delta
MKELSWEEIIKDLRNKVYYPIYLLMGEETFYIDVISDFIEQNVLDENEKEFNQSILYGRDTDIATIVATAKRYPMMASHQVVIIKEAQNIKDIENLDSYVKNPLKSTILVICYKYKTVDKRKTFYKNLGKVGVIMESKKIYDSAMPAWISQYVKRSGYSIGERATQMLADHLGTDLGRVVNELKKVYISLPKGSEITTQLIEQNIGISKDFNIFELQNAIGEKNTLKAFQIVKYFGENPKSNPLVVTLSVLHGFFVKLLLYHSLKDKSTKSVASELKINPYFVGDIQKAASKYPLPKLFDIFSDFREYDLRSKGVNNNSTSHDELLKELVFKIMN